MSCAKRGPYLPVGDTDWCCETHGVELVRRDPELWRSARREDMVCPVGEPDRIVYVVIWGDYLQGVRRTAEEAIEFAQVRVPGVELTKMGDWQWVGSPGSRVRVEAMSV